MLNYSNPRKSVLIENWPYGNKRVRCMFYVEENKGKQRACRVTENPKTGSINKPKKLTYAQQVLIVDGDDDKTYILEKTMNDAIAVMQSNMKYQQEYISQGDERFPELTSMFGDNHESN